MDYINLKKKIRRYLKEHLKASRYRHSLRVSRFAAKLAKRHGLSLNSAVIAGLAHDLARNWKKKQLMDFFLERGISLKPEEKEFPYMLHGRAAAVILKEQFHCEEQNILMALRYHTTGRSGMGPLEQILFIADYLEPGRKHISSSLRRRTKKESLDSITLQVIDHMMDFQRSHNGKIHPWTLEYYEELKQRG